MSGFLEYELAIWLVAAALYVADVIRALLPSQLLLVEARRGAWRVSIARAPFEWGARYLVATGLLLPWAGALTAPRILPLADDATSNVAQELARLDALRARLLPLRLSSALIFTLLFVAGPLIAWRAGLVAALFAAIAPAYLIAVGAGIVLVLRCESLGLSRARAMWIAVESLLCIPLAANVVKKVTAHWSTPHDGITLARARATAAEREELDARLAALKELEQGDAS